MKKTDEALGEAQDKAQEYRLKLEAGEIRLKPEKPSPRIKQREEVAAQQSRRS